MRFPHQFTQKEVIAKRSASCASLIDNALRNMRMSSFSSSKLLEYEENKDPRGQKRNRHNRDSNRWKSDDDEVSFGGKKSKSRSRAERISRRRSF
jgi:hypothetical protein